MRHRSTLVDRGPAVPAVQCCHAIQVLRPYPEFVIRLRFRVTQKWPRAASGRFDRRELKTRVTICQRGACGLGPTLKPENFMHHLLSTYMYFNRLALCGPTKNNRRIPYPEYQPRQLRGHWKFKINKHLSSALLMIAAQHVRAYPFRRQPHPGNLEHLKTITHPGNLEHLNTITHPDCQRAWAKKLEK